MIPVASISRDTAGGVEQRSDVDIWGSHKECERPAVTKVDTYIFCAQHSFQTFFKHSLIRPWPSIMKRKNGSPRVGYAAGYNISRLTYSPSQSLLLSATIPRRPVSVAKRNRGTWKAQIASSTPQPPQLCMSIRRRRGRIIG